ncbi:hypothetical protein [Enterovirga rhinocerotis]|uniref:hypothetical protein n=1 Tax=Enterovirga rhinocerotis TaxID=1339210 RepID=UPI00105F23B1|nr:hypothetical protein [Enterovirga rhinocerotis]
MEDDAPLPFGGELRQSGIDGVPEGPSPRHDEPEAPTDRHAREEMFDEAIGIDVDEALATDAIPSLLQDRCDRKLIAIDVRLNRRDLQAIGARSIPKSNVLKRVDGGRDRD